MEPAELGLDDDLRDPTAEVLKVHPNTVLRDWRLAKMWLKREISKEEPER